MRKGRRGSAGVGGGALLAVAAALALLAACGGETPVEEPVGRTGTVVIARGADVGGVNPLIQRATAVNREIERRVLFEPLLEERVDLASGPPTFDPALAESWSFSDDRLTLTFTLREGLEWSDGAPLTAEDVRWTWQAQIDPHVAWAYATKKERIEDVEVVDPRTVRFHFSDTSGDQLADANEGVVLPRHRWGARPFSEWRSDATWFLDNLATSGPFTLVEWRPNEQLDLARNERYHREGLPRLDRLVFRVIPDKTSQINQLLGGEIDFVEQAPRDEVSRLERSDRVVVDSHWSRQYDYLVWNTRHPLFADPEIRQALTMSIDRQEIIDTLFAGYANLSVSPVLSVAWAFHRGIEPWPYDPQVARLILARKGFTAEEGAEALAREGEALSFALLANAGNRVLLDVATMVQEHLRRVGIDARIETREFNTYVEQLQGGDFEAALGAWNIDTSLDLHYAFHTDGEYNFGRYSSPELDALIDAARATDQIDEKRRLLHEAQEILHREQPYTFLVEPKRINARSSRLRGVRYSVLSSLDFLEEWWVETPGG
ncbi:MAG: ABC transporter substrate-binding protein [Thermoanaerobaculia bacterium]|nr:ABC transporter substrate-binding protein [Thermoanaerobaculia bacterium]